MREGFRQDFDRYVAPEFGIVCLIDLAHATRTNLRGDFVGAETCASSEHHFFNPAVQFTTTVNGAFEACSSSTWDEETALLADVVPPGGGTWEARSKSGFGTPASNLVPLFTCTDIIFPVRADEV